MPVRQQTPASRAKHACHAWPSYRPTVESLQETNILRLVSHSIRRMGEDLAATYVKDLQRSRAQQRAVFRPSWVAK